MIDDRTSVRNGSFDTVTKTMLSTLPKSIATVAQMVTNISMSQLIPLKCLASLGLELNEATIGSPPRLETCSRQQVYSKTKLQERGVVE